uniref:Uncharacterized protein n=1 Tax=Chlamydomonas euryale TaxID=1486919 RepID=A0A7R9W0E2_9CHLO|mmetsp:Transcript_8684/g.26355  ORF Transcript_8684/g.26355 Transcript_8684/m.26355 type:complete len:515 (+) Transcript_8684:534-2078(+)
MRWCPVSLSACLHRLTGDGTIAPRPLKPSFICWYCVAALLLLPVLDTLTSNAQAYGISSECMASATQNLVACLSDLGRLEGCCSSTCAAAINVSLPLLRIDSTRVSNCWACAAARVPVRCHDMLPVAPQSVPEDCIAALTVGTCRMAADGLAVGPVLTPVFSVKRRCIDGVQDTCESIMVPPTTPSPIPSPVPSPVPSPLPVPSPMPTPVPSGSQYPAVVGDGCDIEDVPVPGFDPSTLLPIIETLNENAAAYDIPAECLASTQAQLGACLSDLGLEEGCCSTTCADAVNSISQECYGTLILGVCRMAADGLPVDAVLDPLFNVERRCVSGMLRSCEAFLQMPPVIPSPVPSPVPMPPAPSQTPTTYAYEELGDLDMYGYDLGLKMCRVTYFFCMNQCSDREMCEGFTFVSSGPASGKTDVGGCCYLKTMVRKRRSRPCNSDGDPITPGGNFCQRVHSTRAVMLASRRCAEGFVVAWFTTDSCPCLVALPQVDPSMLSEFTNGNMGATWLKVTA